MQLCEMTETDSQVQHTATFWQHLPFGGLVKSSSVHLQAKWSRFQISL